MNVDYGTMVNLVRCKGEDATDGDEICVTYTLLRPAADSRRNKEKKGWIIDAGWPQKNIIRVDLQGLDEGAANLLTGLVSSILPRVCIETGTHRGRSTQAIVAGLTGTRGHLWTIDATNYEVPASGALSDSELEHVTFCVGKSPDQLGELKAELSGPIDFAFLDAGHHRHELAGELEFVFDNCCDDCIVAVDNTRDDIWTEVPGAISDFIKTHEVDRTSIPTSTGMDILCIHKEQV